MNSPDPKKNRAPGARAILAAAERREAERSEADRSAAAANIAASPAPACPPDPEVVPGAKRRRFTLDYKLRILEEAEAAKNHPGAVGSLLRREGLYSSHLVMWRREREAGVRQALAPKTRGRKPKRDPRQQEIDDLRRENGRLTEALRKAELIIDVQKKVGALLGWDLPKAGQTASC